MTKTIKLLNNGLRNITHAEGVLKPGQGAEISQGEALKLKRLYKGELLDVEERFADVKAQIEAEPKAPEPLKAPEKK